MSKLTRRDVLVGGSAVVATTALGCGTPSSGAGGDGLTDLLEASSHRQASEVAESTELFPLAVGAGAMTQTSALVKSFASTPDAVGLKLWRADDASTRTVRELELRPSESGHLGAALDGLSPGTTYRYAFFSADGSARSAIGTVKTAPADDSLAPVTIGATSCANIKFAPFRSLELLAQEQMDFYLHLGDASYNDDANTLDEFRAKWRQSLGDVGYRALRSAAGGFHGWDDHEIRNNYNPETLNPAVFAAGKEAFYEALPVERLPDDRLWRSQRWGRTLELFILDCRSERRPSTRLEANAQYISPRQMAWLQEALAASPCHFKVIANTVPIAHFAALNGSLADDRWDGYAAQRAELMRFLGNSGVRNVWFVTGDFHLGMVMRLDREGPGQNIWEIAAGPAANVSALAPALAIPGIREYVFPPEQFQYVSPTFAATTLAFDPARDTVQVRFLDALTGQATFDQSLKWGS